MKLMNWMLAVALAAATPLAAQAPAEPAKEPAEKKVEEKKADDKAEEKKSDEADKEAPNSDEAKKEEEEEGGQYTKMLRPMVKGLADITAKVEFNEADVALYLKHREALNKVLDDDLKFEELKKKSYKDVFDYLVKNEKYQAWAKEVGVEAEPFLRKLIRIRSSYMKAFKVDLAQYEEQLNAAAENIEKNKNDMSEQEYDFIKKQLEEGFKDIKGLKKLMETVPGPTDAEKKIMEANKAALEAAMNESDDEEEDESDDEETGEEEGKEDMPEKDMPEEGDEGMGG